MALNLKGRSAEAVPTPSTDYITLFKKTGSELLAVKNSDGSVTSLVPLPADGKISSLYLPSYVDDVLEFANVAALPVIGEASKIYITINTAKIYRWGGSAYVEIAAPPSSTDAVVEGATNLYFTPARVLASVLTGIDLVTSTAVSATDTVLGAIGKLWARVVAHIADTANPHGTTKAQVGLGSADNTSDLNKPISTAGQTALNLKANSASPAFTGTVTGVTKTMVGLGNADDTSDVNKPVSTAQAAADTAALNAARSYADSLVVGLLDDRGNYNASSNTFPSTGGSGAAGAIVKGDLWSISVGGTLGGVAVTTGDVLRALVDAPGATSTNWVITENNIGYVAENSANKNASGGYAGLTGFSINLRNVANTITSFFSTAATAARTWTLPDKSGTVAMTSDITGTNSGTNTGDQDLSAMVTLAGAQTLTNKTLTSPVINAINATPIGGTTPAAGSFTTLSATGGITAGTHATMGGGTETFYADTTNTAVRAKGAGGGIYFQNSTGVTNWGVVSSTGLAVTGALSATGAATAGSLTALSQTNLTVFSRLSRPNKTYSTYLDVTNTGGTDWTLWDDTRGAPVLQVNGTTGGLAVTGEITSTGSIAPGSFTLATRPAHGVGKMIYVSDGGAGAVFQGSNGSAWVNLG